MIYSVVYIFTRSASLNPVTGSLGIRVGLSPVPELLTVLIFVITGILTNPSEIRKGAAVQRTGVQPNKNRSRYRDEAELV